MITIFSQAYKLVKWSETRVFVWYALAVAFFVYAAMVPLLHMPKAAMSPDELANQYSAQLVATTGELWYTEPLNVLAFDRIHPRGFESHTGLVSHSVFWGMALIYGSIARFIGIDHLIWLTPLLAILGSLMIGRGAQRFVSRETAWILASLFLSLPGVVYFSFRTWHHTIPLLVCLIGVWFFGTMDGVCRELTWLFSGACLMFAVLIRPVELLWLFPLLCFIAYFVSRMRGLYWMSVAAVTGLLAFGIHTILQYPSINITQYSVVTPSHTFSWFGTQTLGAIIRTWFAYGPRLYPLLFLFASIGMATIAYYFWHKRIRRGMVLNFLIAASTICLIHLIQVIWYGSFAIDDTGLGIVSVSNSYVRYWLPSITGILVLAGVGIETITERFPKYAGYIGGSIVILSLILSYRTVMRGPDGIPQMHARGLHYDTVVDRMLAEIPENAVVLTVKADKLLFPARRVMVEPFDSPGTRETIDALLAAHVPVFQVTEGTDFGKDKPALDYFVTQKAVIDEFTIYEVLPH